MVDADRVVVCALLCICALQLLAEVCLRAKLRRQLLNNGTRLLQRLLSILHFYKRPAQQRPARDLLFEKRLQDLLQIERIDRWHLAVQFISFPSALLMIANLAARGFFQAAAGVSPLAWHEALGSSSFLVAWYTFTGSQISRLLHPRLSVQGNSVMITCMHLLFTAVYAANLGFNTNSPRDYAHSFSWTLLSRVIVSMMDGSLTNGIVSGVAINIWSVFCRITLLHELRTIDGVLEFLTTCLICGVLWFYKVIKHELVKSTLEAKASRNFKDVGVSLLLKTCDAVVQLSEDFRITDPAPSLSALLLRQSSMEGQNFADLILNADAVNRFFKFMAAASDADGELLLPLRDSGGSAVNVRLMHAQGLDSHDQIFRIIGIQEVCTTQPDPMPHAYVPSQFRTTPLRDVDARSESSSSLDSLDETRSMCTDTVQIDFQDEDMAALLELAGDVISFIKCSAALSSLLGVIQTSEHLFERLRPTDVPNFWNWIRDCLSVGRSKVRRWTFEITGTGRMLRAFVLIDPTPQDSEDANQDQDHTAGVPKRIRSDGIRFKLELVDIRVRKAEKRRSESSSNSHVSQPPEISPGAGAEEEEEAAQPEEVKNVRSDPHLAGIIGRSLAETESQLGSERSSSPASI